MPYIVPSSRAPFDVLVSDFARVIDDFSVSEGHMNYLLTRLLVTWLGPVNYTNLNAVLGVLEAVKLEFYHRKVRGYEDLKMAQNGDAYTGYGS